MRDLPFGYGLRMGTSPGSGQQRRDAWALPEPSAVLLWQLGVGWSSLAAVLDAATGRRIVLSGLVLLGPVCVFLTGRWLRTALAGAWATGLVVVLGIPDGIWGSRLETYLILLAVFVAAVSTLALILTVNTCLMLTVTAFMATGCGGHEIIAARRPTVPAERPVSCRRQYQSWKDGPGYARDRKLQADVRFVLVVEKTGNSQLLRSGLRRLMPAAVAAGLAEALPHCADPGALYADYMTQAYSAGYDAHTAKGLSGLLAAAGPLKGLKGMQSRLDAEVHRALAQK
jgi:hypothetical protein